MRNNSIYIIAFALFAMLGFNPTYVHAQSELTEPIGGQPPAGAKPSVSRSRLPGQIPACF